MCYGRINAPCLIISTAGVAINRQPLSLDFENTLQYSSTIYYDS